MTAWGRVETVLSLKILQIWMAGIEIGFLKLTNNIWRPRLCQNAKTKYLLMVFSRFFCQKWLNYKCSPLLLWIIWTKSIESLLQNCNYYVLSQPGPELDGQNKALAEVAIKKHNRSISKLLFKTHCSSAGQPFITLLWFTFSEHQGLLFLGNVGKSTTVLG